MRTYLLIFILMYGAQSNAQHEAGSWKICDPNEFIAVYTEPVPMNLWQVNDWMQAEKVSGIPEGLFEWTIRILVSETGRVIRSRILTEEVEAIPHRIQTGLDSFRFIPANENGSPRRFWINIDVVMTRGTARFNLPVVTLPTNLEEVYRQLETAISQPSVICHLAVSFRGKVTRVLLTGTVSVEEKKRIENICRQLEFKLENLGRGLHMTIFKRYPDFHTKQATISLERYDPLKEEDSGYHGVTGDHEIYARTLNSSDLMGCVAVPASLVKSDSVESVAFRFYLSREGQLLRIVGTLGMPELWEALLPCLRQLRFSPAYENGRPVDSWLDYPVSLCPS